MESNEDGEKLSSTDFYMEYKVKCSSYLYSKPFDRCYSQEVLDDGMTLYTVKTFKTHDLSFDCVVILGNSDDMFMEKANIEASTNKDYVVDKVTSGKWRSENYDGAYVDSDGTIILDLYYVSESYSKIIADNLAKVSEEMMSCLSNNISYEDCYARNKKYMFDTDDLRHEFESFTSRDIRILSEFNYIDCNATKWEYPKQFRYSDGEYIISATIEMSAQVGNNEPRSSSSNLYGLFKPGEEGLKLYAVGNSVSQLYETDEPSSSDDTSSDDDYEEEHSDDLDFE